ncbi:MAG: polysaccharide deacetylase family protein [Chitinophagales bacterium]
MYWIKTPRSLPSLFPDYIWKLTGEKEIYLTFDDGPVPGVTDEILNILKAFHAKATFFCIGENVMRYSKLYDRLQNENHTVGNHTFNHLNGWKMKDSVYLQNVAQCRALVESNLFRPPYGRIGIRQAQQIKKDYKIIMWDVLSGDFDQQQTVESCTRNVIKNVEPGSIVVFHDSLKAKPRVLGCLPAVLENFSKAGYQCKSIVL